MSESKELVTAITEAHHQIGDALLAKVREMISRQGVDIVKYSIDGSYGSFSIETIEICVNPVTSLTIRLQTG